ncbi:hypothetical protein DL764_010748 [Monosporascus ibericus]|uniref:Uncharacterized protein n=1 Tax=Monosporascus ibericus TaxID=155417 RepID=A0A4V1X8M6_9PEZI|nr:hypothetical protein DL764_010748 [Monosporascus ibericus]
MATTTRSVWVPGETDNLDGPLTTTFTPDDSCFEVHYLRAFHTSAEVDLVSFMPYDAYHPQYTEIVPTCGLRTSRNGCYPPGDWSGPTFSPGLYCPMGWTTASVSPPYLTWCCPSGLIFDHDTVYPWCNFPPDSTRVTMTVDCTLTTFAIGPSQTTTLTLLDYQNRSELVVPASNVVLFGGAVAIALVGDAATTMPSSTGGEEAATTMPSSTGGEEAALETGDPGSSSSSSHSAKIGAAVGATVGGLLLLALGLLLLRRYRRRRLLLRQDGSGNAARGSELDAGPAAAELGGVVYLEKEANSKTPPAELPTNRQHAELGGSAPPPPRVYEME